MDARKCGLQWAARAKNSRFSVERIGESQRATALLMCVSCLVRSCATSTCYGTTRASEAQSPVVGAASSPSAPPVLYWEDVCCGLERWTHRWMMHTRLGTRLTAQAAPRWHGSWHGVAHPAATLQALCPTAGLGCCENKRRRVGPGAGGWRSLGEVRESGARGVLAHLRGAHRESIHSRNCCLDMPTAFATCRGVGCRVSAACLCPSVETVSSVSEDPPHHVGCRYV